MENPTRRRDQRPLTIPDPQISKTTTLARDMSADRAIKSFVSFHGAGCGRFVELASGP
jgi:hypothetical protein